MAFYLYLLHKELKDKQQIEAIEDLFYKADKNNDGKISISDYVEIFSTHGIPLRWDIVKFLLRDLIRSPNESFGLRDLYKNM